MLLRKNKCHKKFEAYKRIKSRENDLKMLPNIAAL